MTIELLQEQITEIVREDLVYLLETFENDIQCLDDFNEHYYTMDKIDERDLLSFMVEIYFDEMETYI